MQLVNPPPNRTDMSEIRVLAFLKYGDRAASTRQRLLQYIPYLARTGIKFEHSVLLDNSYVASIGTKSKVPTASLIGAYVRRVKAMRTMREYDAIWIYMELLPYLPGFLESLALPGNVPVIYDFDDAVFHQYDAHPSALVRKALGRKLQPLLRQVRACSCGNKYLEAYASQFCRDTQIIPTVVDAEIFAPRLQSKPPDQPIVIGWIGSPSTWQYVAPLVPLLRRICHERNVQFKVVGAGNIRDDFPQLVHRPWAEETEVTELQSMDIGIMPLPDQPWARGKCGYKLIQYMACSLPVVASPVGVNVEIVQHNENGFLAKNMDEWEGSLVNLIQDRALREAMGCAGRRKVQASYSLQAQAPKVEEIIRRAVQK
jgi:glycosyltransferase involved in cell wall biosynthesis